MTPAKVSEFLKGFLGVKYTWWHEGDPISKDAPFYSLGIEDELPSLSIISEKGVNCAGLLNLARAFCKKEGLEGTYQWETPFTWLPLTKDTNLIEGVVLFRKYADDSDQGHLSYVISETEFIHSCDYDEIETGVCISKIEEWRHYFTHWLPFEEVF
jgi:hypothetical protein